MTGVCKSELFPMPCRKSHAKAPREGKAPSELMKFHLPDLVILARRLAPDTLRWALHPESALR